MKNKKRLKLFLSLVCMVLCVFLTMTACNTVKEEPEDTKSTVGTEQTEPTEGKPSIPEETEPEQTEPEETEPEQPTEPEETEPEETQASGNSGGQNVNTGTGGGYDPGTSQPTEPENATEPPIVVPEPGSENNAYAEYVPEASGSFTTVTIPAGKEMHYRLKTNGSFLRVEDADAMVIWGEAVYRAENGVLEMALPADYSQAIALAFTNQNPEDKAFTVEIMGIVGSQSNPIALESIANIQTELAENDEDGVWYCWKAAQSGVLKMTMTSDAADALITVGGKTVSLREGNGQASIAVNAEDEVLIQVLGPAGNTLLSGYVAAIVELEISEIPSQVESVTVQAGQSVIYRIAGINEKSLKLVDSDFCAAYNGVLYSPDAEGMVLVNLPGAVEVELFNRGAEPKATLLYFDYPVGHKLNPQRLTALDQLAVTIPENQDGYYYSYTASRAGMVTFQIWTYPQMENVKTDIVIVNETTGETAALWSETEGEAVENATASVNVTKSDKLTIWVNVTDIFGYGIYTDLEILGGLYGTEELPIVVAYPGFTANVPAGETLYYEGYNMADLILSMTGSDVTVTHNGVNYAPISGEITFPVITEGRNPAKFAITNNGSEAASYDVTFTYPVGHMENPADLVLGTNTVTQAAGASEYYYTFTAPRDGTLTFTFDSNAQWVYTVNNLTQGVYGDTQWSDSDPVQPETTVSVVAGDCIVIHVNTYDAANTLESPAGTVVFEAKYVSGPNAVETVPGTVDAVLIPGECAEFTGNFQGYNLVISDAKNVVVSYNGAEYRADANDEITVEFTDSEILTFTVQNVDNAELTLTLKIVNSRKGTQDNPDTMQVGANVMTQNENGGADYYYTFTATKAGRLKITINTGSNWTYKITNLTQNRTSGKQLSLNGKKTYTLAVKAGDVIELQINTFDPKTGKSCEGTVEFTIEH